MARVTITEEKLNYLKKLTSQEKIAKAALNDSEWEVRLKAVEILTDEVALRKVAIIDEMARICLEALKKITDGTQIYEVAKHAKYPDVRAEAVRKMTFEPAIEEIALRDDNHNVRMWATDAIKDEERLLNIVEKTNDEWLAYNIVHRLSKESLAKVKSDNWFITESVEDLLSQ